MAICHCWPLSQALIKLLQVTSLGATSPQIKQSLSLGHFPTPRFAADGVTILNPKHILEVPNQNMMGLVMLEGLDNFHVLVVATSRGCKHLGGHRHCSSQVLRSISSKVATARCQPSIRWLSAMALMVAEKLKMSGSNLSRMQYSSQWTHFKTIWKSAVQIIHLNLLENILDDYRYMKVNRLKGVEGKVEHFYPVYINKVGWISACFLLRTQPCQPIWAHQHSQAVCFHDMVVSSISIAQITQQSQLENNKVDPKGRVFVFQSSTNQSTDLYLYEKIIYLLYSNMQ